MVTRFLTDSPCLTYWKKDLYLLRDNVIFRKDNKIYLVPRGFITDFYSIPNWIATPVGDSAGRDQRPALLHDFICAYHSAIVVKLSEQQLEKLGYLYKEYDSLLEEKVTKCKDIPQYYLELVPFTKVEANNILYDGMKSLMVDKAIPIRLGVAFNFNWYITKNTYNWDRLYKLDNHYNREGIVNYSLLPLLPKEKEINKERERGSSPN